MVAGAPGTLHILLYKPSGTSISLLTIVYLVSLNERSTSQQLAPYLFVPPHGNSVYEEDVAAADRDAVLGIKSE